MGNPRTTDRGNCFDCNANGGPPETMRWAIRCLRPRDSGKTVSRVPEAGCAFWEPIPPNERSPEPS